MDWFRKRTLGSLLHAAADNFGERVALWTSYRPEWLYLMFAIAKVGACIVPLKTGSKQ